MRSNVTEFIKDLLKESIDIIVHEHPNRSIISTDPFENCEDAEQVMQKMLLVLPDLAQVEVRES